ncbi:pyridoxamine 5'-phosphate oxidase family protein [Actinotalea sp. BY-33]|uniref:Pyridoxamine 5'-phosphate oxidase family protein n=1 Tax=Actinotalea soli TaxID=2819234 RepID=A0A939LUP2_9CELL|nr:pyridoxamine 5'-phosphate oxidase family protein [Actinotalea soli]MBO1753030.1 pyridoxamine 5'-phosphate oxidase family protein [Actinotalea soli]
MTRPRPRSRAVRIADTVATLSTPAIDVWVATASPEGRAHLVPLTLCWVDERVVLALDGSSSTARNLRATGTARLAVGPTRDVVMIDAVLEHEVDQGADARLGAAYADQADWDPRGSEGYVYLVLRPDRVQAWREVEEAAGRDLMRDGRWLV